MDEIKHQIVERLKQANNILVTVRNNPSVDLLSACIGLSLVLDKMDKHAAAVFSGEVPNAIEFLKPEDTIEQTPDSLRDFIIALDKSKADKLRYKVEDKVVRIFITPYKTSLSQDDLEFSQGDFNVDAVVALGAHEQQDLDQAITVHGRILHDATLISINNTPNGNLGSMNWQEIGASSISEMVTELVQDLHKEALDGQIATALLTGIVAETERFSNDKTTPRTMSLAGDLMTAGANQQLVATSLQAASLTPHSEQQPQPIAHVETGMPQSAAESAASNDDGTLEIDHEPEPEAPSAPEREPEPESATAHAESALESAAPELPQVITPSREMLPTVGPARRTNDFSSSMQETPFTAEYEESPMPVRSYLVDRPVMPTAALPSGMPPIEPSQTNPFDVPPAELPAPVLNHVPPVVAPPSTQPWAPAQPLNAAPVQMPEPVMPSTPPFTVPASVPPAVNQQPGQSGQTLREIEESVHSPHLVDVNSARGQVMDAFRYEDKEPLTPLKSLNAFPLGDPLHSHADVPPSPAMGIMVDADGNLKQADLQGSMPSIQGLAVAPPPAVPPPMTPPKSY